MAVDIFSKLPRSGSTVVNGTSGNDTLAGYLGNDTLIGGAGNDVFYETFRTWSDDPVGGFLNQHTYNFGSGNDVIYGGAGSDWLVYENRITATVLNLSTRVVTIGQEHDSFSGIENFALGEGADKVIGKLAGVGLFLGGGNDTLNGASGFAGAIGGLGQDLLDCTVATAAITIDLLNQIGPDGAYISEFENVIGALRFANHLKADHGVNILTGGDRADTLLGLAGNDSLYGGNGDDSLYGGEEDDLLLGGAGNDYLYGHFENDRLYAGLGNDRVYGSAGNDLLSGGDGADYIFGGNEDDVIYGGAMNDHIFGGAGFDRLYGGDGDDTLTSAGNDNSAEESYYAGAGNDTVYLTGSSPSGDMRLGSGNDLVNSPTADARFLLCEDGDDRVLVLSGNVSGGNGNDRIALKEGVIDGGAGNDTLSIAIGEASGTSRVNAGSGNDIVSLGALGPIEYAPVIGAIGGAGHDVLKLYDGNVLVSIAPIYEGDRLTSVSGFEEILILDTDVQVRYQRLDTIHSFGATNDVLNIATGTGAYATGAGNDDVSISVMNITLDTGAGDDSIEGQQDVQNIMTGAGNDSITLVGGGNVSSGDGNDRLFLHGNGAIDAGSGDDNLQLGELWMTTESGQIIRLQTVGNLTTSSVTVGTGNDTVVVNSRPANLDLGEGNDRVSVVTHSGVLWNMSGGSGADHFQFRVDMTKANVRITDFDTGQDELALEHVATLADLDSVTAYGTGVHIVEGQWSIYLPTVTLDQMATVKFVALHHDI